MKNQDMEENSILKQAANHFTEAQIAILKEWHKSTLESAIGYIKEIGK